MADLLFVLPCLGLVGFFIILPVCTVIFRSVYNWNPGSASPFTGLSNYEVLNHSSVFHQILGNEFFYLLGIPLWTLLPIVVAVLLYERVPAAGVFRTIFFIPAVISPALLGILFLSFLGLSGPLDTILREVGLGSLARDWLNSSLLVKPSIIVLMAWASFGTGVVIFSAALSGVDPALFEAAVLDGASWLQRLRYIVLPSLRSVIEIWVVLQVVNVFTGMFGWIFVLTAGGPSYASSTLDYDIYTNAIVNGNFGLAAAESVYLLVIVVLLIGGLILLFRTDFLARAATWVRGKGTRMIRVRLRSTREELAWTTGADRDWSRELPLPPLRWALRTYGRRMKTYESKSRSWSRTRLAVLVAALVPFVYPFAFLISMALKTPRAWAQDQTGFSAHLTTVNLASAWSGANLGRATLNSLLAVIVGSVVCTCVAAGGAYWFLRHWNRVSQALLGILICFWVLPYVVFIIPLFVTLARLGLINNLWILGLLYAASYIPFGIYLVHAYLRNAAIAEVVEAARVDGANSFGVFRRIVVPLSKPVLGTLAALTFVWCWGDLIGALVILQDPGHWTVTVAASALVGRYGMQTQTGAAAALIGIVPVIAVFLFAQKAIVRGITAGVGK